MGIIHDGQAAQEEFISIMLDGFSQEEIDRMKKQNDRILHNSPMLITFLGLPAYEAVGIALASDVLPSAISAYTYGKNKNLDIRNGLVMMVTVLIFTLVGWPQAAFRIPLWAVSPYS